MRICVFSEKARVDNLICVGYTFCVDSKLFCVLLLSIIDIFYERFLFGGLNLGLVHLSVPGD